MYTYKKIAKHSKIDWFMWKQAHKNLWEENWEDYKMKEKFCYHEGWTEDAA